MVPSQLKTNENVLTSSAILNSLPVMVHALAEPSELIVANTPSSEDTVRVHPSAPPEGGTRYAKLYQYDPFVAGVASV